ncbi:MAG: hydrogenase expression protein [Leifsonia sp.]|nr:hydrogenase expression protein [Leifsonia sp.]
MHLLSLFSLRNRALIALVTIVIGLFGGIAITQLKQELFPSISLPQVSISTSYPGASPAVVENDVSTPVEAALQGISGLSGTSATSGSGLSLVTAEFDYGTDLTTAEQKVQLALNRIANQLPDDVTPTVATFSFDDFPVIQLAVTSDLDSNELTSRLETIAVPEFQSLDGVSEASVTGGAGERVEITYDPEKLEDNNLTTQSIVDALNSAGVLLAVGEIAEDGTTLTVQSGARIESVDELRALPVLGGYTTSTETVPGLGEVTTSEAQELTIDDLATVDLVDNPSDSIARVNGEPSLAVAITKTATGNTVDVSHAVSEALEEVAAKVGSNTEFTVVFDQAPSIERSIETLATEGLLGLAAAILVIFVFLVSIRSTLVTAISIPASLLVTFIGMWASGYSLNVLTLGAITISIGRVVDDSIVVIENIKRHLALGDDKLTAINTGVREVATAITASTITTIAVFLPLALVSDITGELFRPFAVTVTIALAASLFVALTIVPVLAYWFLGRKPLSAKAIAKAEAAQAAAASGEDELERPTRLQKVYLPVIRWTLRRPAITLLAAVLVMGGTIATVPLLQTNFIGSSGANTITVTQTIDAGSDLEAKDAAATKVEQALIGVEGVEIVQSSIGGGNQLAAFFGGGDDATFSLTTDEDGDQDEITAAVRAAIDDLSDVGEVTVGGGESAAFASSDISILISAGDEDALLEATSAVLDAVSDLDVTAEATSNLAASRPFISVDVDREAAAEYNLSELAVGSLVAQAMQPAASGDFELDNTVISIYLVDPDEPETLEQLREYELQTPTGDTVRLEEIAEVEITNGPTSITTERGVRTSEVTLTPNTADLGSAGAIVTAAVADVDLPDGASASVGGAVADQQEGFAQLGLAALASLLIVYIIMVATFRSLRQPLLLLVSVPFAATGAILLQLASGVPFGIASIIGVIMLIGIVVTNAIVLVDLVNQYRDRGMKVAEAVEHGSSRRLRPILMTALATIVALIPMALGITGEGGFISQPLAIVVIGGLLSSTLLTLVVLPTLYALVEGSSERRAAKREARAAAAETAAS